MADKGTHTKGNVVVRMSTYAMLHPDFKKAIGFYCVDNNINIKDLTTQMFNEFVKSHKLIKKYIKR